LQILDEDEPIGNPSIRQSVNRQSGIGFSDCRFQVENESIRQSANRQSSIGHWIFGLQISGGGRVNPSIRQSVNRQSGTGFSDCRFQMEDETIRQSVNPPIRQSANPSIRQSVNPPIRQSAVRTQS
jgi:hypothetical protein